MAIKKYKPTSNGRRGMTTSDFAEITTDKPEKSLLAPLHKKGGRNNQGKLTVRHQGGKNKNMIDQPLLQWTMVLNLIKRIIPMLFR